MKPSYAPKHSTLVEGDLVTWEVIYGDGGWLREAEGATYKDIDRGRLHIFRLVAPGECLFEAFVPEGMTGKNLIYRRRTDNTFGDRHVCFVIAWMPGGPAFFIDPANNAWREEPRGLIPHDPDLYPPVYLPEEGEGLVLRELQRVKVIG